MQTQFRTIQESHSFTNTSGGRDVKTTPSPIFNLDYGLKRLHVQPLFQSSLRQKNVVWLSKEDCKELWGPLSSSDSSEVSRYIQVADQVYRVMVGCAIEKGWMAVSNLQIGNMGDAIFRNDHSNRMVSAIPFDPKSVETFSLQKAIIHVSEELLLDDCSKIIMEAEQLKKVLKEKLKGEYLAKGKQISVGFPWGELRAEVVNMFFSDPHKKGYGIIEENTQLFIKQYSSKQVIIVNEIYHDEVQHFDFQVTVRKRLSKANRNLFPLVISADQIKDHIKKELVGRLLCRGIELTFPHPSGWDVVVRLKQCVLNSKVSSVNQQVIYEDLEEGFVLSQNSNLRLKSDLADIVLTGSSFMTPEAMTFKVADIPNEARHATIDQDKERWIHLDELKHILFERKFYVLNEVFEVVLSSGSYYIKIAKIKCEVTRDIEDKKYETCWKIDSDKTLLEFETEKELEINLVQDMTPIHLRKASFQISEIMISENSTNLTTAELKKLILAQAPKKIVKNQSFPLHTEFEGKLELKLLDVEFEGDPIFVKERTAFGTINEATDLEFSSSAVGKINIIEKIYEHEIEQINMGLTAIKRKGVSKVARIPLVIDEQEMIEKIRKELTQQKYILEGFTTTIAHGEGWDIQAKFVKGVLSKETENRKSDHRFVHVTAKKAFVCKEQTPIEFVTPMKDVILVKGKVALATSLNIRLIEVLESYKKDNDTFVKGNWINLQELKEALQEYPKPITTKEKIAFDLESGKFLFEIRQAKQEGIITPKQKEWRHSRWTVGLETKIHLNVGKFLDIQKVKDKTAYPLQSVEFIVYRNDETDEHLSLNDREIKQALKDLLPCTVIKSHELSIETEQNHSLRLAVKEMKLKEGSRENTSELFGLILEETEILLKGKEDSNLAIRTSPKILEVEDPLKYLEERGIGGIDEQFKQLYRILFSRSKKLGEEASRRGTKPIKGILLYGPPGTGKTTLAKHLGEMLGCSGERLKMLTATEIFNMWFGESEENIREIFAPAKRAQNQYGKESPFYIIIIDEIDALLPKRGGSVNKVRDTLVNQFLGEADGLKELNNLLIVGITNRKEDIDEAALRHGRFGIHIEIGLPDFKGREKIFEIHTKQLRNENLLHQNVNFKELAAKTDKFSGADIEGIVEEASLLSLERLNSLKLSKEDLKLHKAGLVTMRDFEQVLATRKKKEEGIPQHTLNAMYT